MSLCGSQNDNEFLFITVSRPLVAVANVLRCGCIDAREVCVMIARGMYVFRSYEYKPIPVATHPVYPVLSLVGALSPRCSFPCAILYLELFT
jgi:hypothetical protein